MAKNTSKKSAKKNTALFQKFISSKWYIKTLIIIVVAVLGFMIFKKCINTYNISLLDKAEAKMRAMDLPKADSTEYRRSCSFRSVKFGSAGSPLCHIQRIDTYDVKNSIEQASELLRNYLELINDQEAQLPQKQLTDKLSNNTEYSIPKADFTKGLKCNHYIEFATKYTNAEDLNNNYKYLIIATNCSRRFMFQTYPELN